MALFPCVHCFREGSVTSIRGQRLCNGARAALLSPSGQRLLPGSRKGVEKNDSKAVYAQDEKDHGVGIAIRHELKLP